jgi:hypothetical protein
MTDPTPEWILEAIDPARRMKRIHVGLRKIKDFPLGRSKVSEVLHELLRHADDDILGRIWREWREIGRIDLAMEAEIEMERRKNHSVGRG